MTLEQATNLAVAWDRLQIAIQRVEVTSPQAMTTNILALTHERVAFNKVVLALGRSV